ncbi:MAG: xanthine dehydrogenase family protein subunit M [Aigarchaeota archaeon]|nr:xanthine dehydrogenase family protein subunit M [Aigarchaeota archaeon]
MSFGSPYLTLPEFQYLRPKSLEEVLNLLDQHGEEANILAGGVALIGFMKERLLAPQYVIDIKALEEFNKIKYTPGKELHIGPTVTFNQIIASKPVEKHYGALYDAARSVGDITLRNRATLVGNICEALPWNDGLASLTLFEAELALKSLRSERSLHVEEFIKGIMETDIRPDEIITSIHIPEPPENSRSTYVKTTSRSEFSIANLGALVSNPNIPEKRLVRLAYAAAAPTPVRVPEAEKVFRRPGKLSDLIDEAMPIILEKVAPMTDMHASSEYRTHLIDVLTRKVLRQLIGGR